MFQISIESSGAGLACLWLSRQAQAKSKHPEWQGNTETVCKYFPSLQLSPWPHILRADLLNPFFPPSMTPSHSPLNCSSTAGSLSQGAPNGARSSRAFCDRERKCEGSCGLGRGSLWLLPLGQGQKDPGLGGVLNRTAGGGTGTGDGGLGLHRLLQWYFHSLWLKSPFYYILLCTELPGIPSTMLL